MAWREWPGNKARRALLLSIVILCGYIVLYGQHYFQIRYNMKLAQPHTVIILSTELLWKPPWVILFSMGKSYWAIGSWRSQKKLVESVHRLRKTDKPGCSHTCTEASGKACSKSSEKYLWLTTPCLGLTNSCCGTGCVFLSVTSTHQGSHLESTVDAFTTSLFDENYTWLFDALDYLIYRDNKGVKAYQISLILLTLSSRTEIAWLHFDPSHKGLYKQHITDHSLTDHHDSKLKIIHLHLYQCFATLLATLAI